MGIAWSRKVIVNNAGNLIILIMSNDADALHDSFLGLQGILQASQSARKAKLRNNCRRGCKMLSSIDFIYYFLAILIVILCHSAN